MASEGKVLRRANPSTIHDKFLVGYQGWFTCAGDGPPLDPRHHGWLHWFNFPIPDGGRPNLDIWPDVSEYSPSELFPAPGLKLANGEQAFLFSSRHPRTVQRHFHWMALHGVDGAFLQRFVGQCDIERGNTAIRNMRDEVGDRVREAAEKEGRVFAIMYDVVGVEPDRVRQVIEQDWLHLIHEKGVLDSPNYLREKGKPVITLWGFGFSDGKHDPANVRAITNFIRTNTPGGAYIVAGVPAHWRTSNNDASSNHEWVNVWLEEFDAISPWTIGRYHSLEEVDRFYEEKMKGDAELIRRNNEEVEAGRSGVRKVEYIPVVLPGGSGFNLSEGQWAWNDTPRRGGNFMWKQLFNARRVNVRTIYGAMWDEYDEGTAYLPVVQNKRLLPKHEKFNFMALDEDGFDLPSDWYMRICGFAAEGLRGERMIHETFPNKELQDYWSTRPRYEDVQSVPGPSCASGSGSASGNNKNEKKADELWEDWTKTHGEHESDEPPPPPYTLEDTSSATPIPGPSTSSTSTIQPQRQHTITSHSSSASQAQYHPPTPLGTRPTIEQSSSAPIPPSVSRPTLSSSDVSHLANGFQAPMQSSSGSYASAKPPPVVLTSRPNIPSQGTLPLSSNPYGNNIPTPGQLTQPQPRIDAGYCLPNDFGKLAVGSQATLPPPPLVPKPSTSLSSSPPPLHPSHPKRLESQYRPLDTSLTKTPPPLHPKSPLKRIQSSGPSSMESSNSASAQQNASNSGATWGAGQHSNQTPSTAPSGGQSQQPVHQQSVYNPTYSPVYQNQPPAPSSSRPHAQPINHSYSMSSHSPSPPIPNGPPIPTPPAPGGISQSTSYTYGTTPASSYEQGVGGFSFPPAQPSFPTNDYYTQPVSGTAYGGPPPGQPQQYPQPVPPQPQYPPSQPQYPPSQPQPPQGYGAQPYGYGQPQAPGMYPGGVNGAAGYSQYPGQGQGQGQGQAYAIDSNPGSSRAVSSTSSSSNPASTSIQSKSESNSTSSIISAGVTSNFHDHASDSIANGDHNAAPTNTHNLNSHRDHHPSSSPGSAVAVAVVGETPPIQLGDNSTGSPRVHDGSSIPSPSHGSQASNLNPGLVTVQDHAQTKFEASTNRNDGTRINPNPNSNTNTGNTLTNVNTPPNQIPSMQQAPSTVLQAHGASDSYFPPQPSPGGAPKSHGSIPNPESKPTNQSQSQSPIPSIHSTRSTSTSTSSPVGSVPQTNELGPTRRNTSSVIMPNPQHPIQVFQIQTQSSVNATSTAEAYPSSPPVGLETPSRVQGGTQPPPSGSFTTASENGPLHTSTMHAQGTMTSSGSGSTSNLASSPAPGSIMPMLPSGIPGMDSNTNTYHGSPGSLQATPGDGDIGIRQPTFITSGFVASIAPGTSPGSVQATIGHGHSSPLNQPIVSVQQQQQLRQQSLTSTQMSSGQYHDINVAIQGQSQPQAMNVIPSQQLSYGIQPGVQTQTQYHHGTMLAQAAPQVGSTIRVAKASVPLPTTQPTPYVQGLPIPNSQPQHLGSEPTSHPSLPIGTTTSQYGSIVQQQFIPGGISTQQHQQNQLPSVQMQGHGQGQYHYSTYDPTQQLQQQMANFNVNTATHPSLSQPQVSQLGDGMQQQSAQLRLQMAGGGGGGSQVDVIGQGQGQQQQQQTARGHKQKQPNSISNFTSLALNVVGVNITPQQIQDGITASGKAVKGAAKQIKKNISQQDTTLQQQQQLLFQQNMMQYSSMMQQQQQPGMIAVPQNSTATGHMMMMTTSPTGYSYGPGGSVMQNQDAYMQGGSINSSIQTIPSSMVQGQPNGIPTGGMPITNTNTTTVQFSPHAVQNNSNTDAIPSGLPISSQPQFQNMNMSPFPNQQTQQSSMLNQTSHPPNQGQTASYYQPPPTSSHGMPMSTLSQLPPHN